MGLKREEPTPHPEEEVEEHVECWPDNWLPLQVFSVLSTQWNWSHSGVVGMRFEAIPTAMRMVAVPEEDEQRVLSALKAMEKEALQVFNHKNG